MSKLVKTWRVFLFGLGCILAGIYLRIALTYFRNVLYFGESVSKKNFTLI